MEMSDHDEHLLVQRLRSSPEFIPELSLVAEHETDGIVGHILLSPVHLVNEAGAVRALALAPVSVLPEYQNQGIGSQLIRSAHRVARGLKHSCIVLIGHADYYPRFGYLPAIQFDIHFPFDIPAENCLLLPLQQASTLPRGALVTYPAEFQVDT